MGLIATAVTACVLLGMGYLVLRAYLLGKTDGLNSELFD